jgi:hypothetical protein
MSFWKPKSKSVATVTARTMDAWGSDLIRAGQALQEAAKAYRSGEPVYGENYARSAFNLSCLVLRMMGQKDRAGQATNHEPRR